MNAKTLIRSFLLALSIMAVLGFAYPTATALITEHALPWQSSGSPVIINGTVYGSVYLAEAFNSSVFFQPRPSATGYNLSQSGSTEISPDNPAFLNMTEHYLKQFMSENPGINISQVPYDMVSPSASGLDPNIPVAGAYDQVARIGQSIVTLGINSSANLSISSVEAFLNYSIKQNEKQNFPLFGSYYVNTVTLNFIIIQYLMDKGILPGNFLQ
ncbi:MAG: potassium-transporting ATPase subunit C [Thermoplasmataceae archaeon]